MTGLPERIPTRSLLQASLLATTASPVGLAEGSQDAEWHLLHY